MNFKKILSLLLAVMMVLSFAACGQTQDEGEENVTTTEPQATEPQEPAPTDPQIAALSFLTISISDEEGNTKSIYVMDNEDGTAHVDYAGAIIKRGELEDTILTTLANALAQSGLMELNGKNEGDFEISMATASLYAELADGTTVSADFYGIIPEEFLNGYDVLAGSMDMLTAEMGEYVPAPTENGEIAESDKTALDAILSTLDLGVPADSFVINGIAKDEYFAGMLGLSSDEGIASGLNFGSMNMSVAYSLNIVTLAEGGDVNTVAEDFEANVDWLKWLCVQPSNVLIATNGNQVLCLMGSDEIYTNTASAIEAAGWTTYATLENPNM